ncbi:XRE family transcriptional regulator [Lactobacillus melliventris]|uniref:XRE family transcriptional regulator n=1 Tax=Lactobacillus melliventris TaxID=1218507 RepID=A0A0F4LAG6_9LACO|nr:XRE family transcriptional regulator [Lactobacillus melliventris]
MDKSVTVGHKVNILHVILGLVLVILVSLFMTGFGYQPWWVLGLIILVGIFITLPTCFSGYWQINKNGITVLSYSSNDVMKLMQLLHIKKIYTKSYLFENITKAEITYRKKVRISPIDFNPDFFKLNLTVNNKVIQLELGNIQAKDLVEIVVIFNTHGVAVYDRQQIIGLLEENKSLFNHFHNGKWASL